MNTMIRVFKNLPEDLVERLIETIPVISNGTTTVIFHDDQTELAVDVTMKLDEHRSVILGIVN